MKHKTSLFSDLFGGSLILFFVFLCRRMALKPGPSVRLEQDAVAGRELRRGCCLRRIYTTCKVPPDFGSPAPAVRQLLAMRRIGASQVVHGCLMGEC